LLKTALNMKAMFGRVFNKYTSKVKTDEDKSSFPKKKNVLIFLAVILPCRCKLILFNQKPVVFY